MIEKKYGSFFGFQHFERWLNQQGNQGLCLQQVKGMIYYFEKFEGKKFRYHVDVVLKDRISEVQAFDKVVEKEGYLLVKAPLNLGRIDGYNKLRSWIFKKGIAYEGREDEALLIQIADESKKVFYEFSDDEEKKQYYDDLIWVYSGRFILLAIATLILVYRISTVPTKWIEWAIALFAFCLSVASYIRARRYRNCRKKKQ